MSNNKKSRKKRTIKQIDVLKGVRKPLPPPTVVYTDKRRKKTRILTDDEMGRIDCWYYTE